MRFGSSSFVCKSERFETHSIAVLAATFVKRLSSMRATRPMVLQSVKDTHDASKLVDKDTFVLVTKVFPFGTALLDLLFSKN